MAISLRFLGAAGGVTGSQYLLSVGQRRVLVDCGLFQGGMEEIARNRMAFSYGSRDVDAVLLTHAHNDHIGRLPALVRAGYRHPVFTTDATADLAEIVLTDSAHLQMYAAERWKKHHPEEAAVKAAAQASGGESEATATETEMAATAAKVPKPAPMHTESHTPLFDVDDVQRTIDLVRPVAYQGPVTVTEGVEATFYDAGHILGSAIIELRVRDHGGEEMTIVFSGDLGRPDTPILRDPTPLTHADAVIVESTYGDREHPDASQAIAELTAVVNEVAARGGVLLIPAFAIGRTQHVVWLLDDLVRKGAIAHLPLFIDSPMACEANDVYLRHPEGYDAETLALLQSGDSPLVYPGQACTTSVEASKAIVGSPRPFILVSASGMLTGGRILHHLKDLLPDPATTLLFIGYQGEGTLGRYLADGGKEAHIDGKTWPVRCRVQTISGLSAHADETELDTWIGHFGTASQADGKPRAVYVTHGEPDAAAAFAARIGRNLGVQAVVPALGESVTLRA
ncbi:MAG TPA: MBL fold metallo-hydrolase [Candidatus Limnocylindria bacterium]